MRDSIVESTRVRYVRNIQTVPFPNKFSSEDDANKVLNYVEKAIFASSQNFTKPCFLHNLTKMSLQDLYEKHYVNLDVVNHEYASLILDKQSPVSILINEEDHVRISAVLEGNSIDKTFNLVDSLDKKFAKNIDYAFMGEFGYLSPSLSNTGTGMKVSAILFLPGLSLSKEIVKVVADDKLLGFSLRGYAGEDNYTGGYKYQLYNTIAIGKSAKDIISDFKFAIDFIIEAEAVALEKTLKDSYQTLVRFKQEVVDILNDYSEMSIEQFYDFAGKLKLLKKLNFLEFDLKELKKVEKLVMPYKLCVFLKNAKIEDNNDARHSVIKNWFKQNVR